MSLRDSLDLIQAVKPEAGHSALQREIEVERASSLSAAEKRVIDTLKALREADADRTACLIAAQQAVWGYFVQRELIGFRRHHDVIRDLEIPAPVLNGLGVMPPNRKPQR
jgi:hypothetical protein